MRSSSLLSEYEHPERETRLEDNACASPATQKNCYPDRSPEKKRLRTFVIREFLLQHYSGKRGWRSRWLRCFSRVAGRRRSDHDFGENREAPPYRGALYLGDGTVETWDADRFLKQSGNHLADCITVKSGRQKRNDI